jgi:hypothetical protein
MIVKLPAMLQNTIFGSPTRAAPAIGDFPPRRRRSISEQHMQYFVLANNIAIDLLTRGQGETEELGF